MNEDKINFTSDDLQKTMEVPVVGGKSEPVDKVFDSWHADSGGLPQEILDSIAKSLSEAEKMPETITVSLNPAEEETAEEIVPEPEKKTDDTMVVPAVPEKELSADATMVLPVTPAPKEQQPNTEPEKKADDTTVVPVVPEKELSADATIVLPVTPAPKEEKTEESAEEIVRQKAPKGRLWPPVLISSIFMVIACCITLVIGIMPVLVEHGFTRGMTQIIAPVIATSDPPAYTNVLLVGVDEDGYRTDTMMVATYDVKTKKVSVMQLPRDTYVHNNGRTDKKLNSAYYSGIEQLQREVQIAYGIETHKYVEINLEGFRKLIDAIGGVEVVVPFNMIYDDPTQDFHIYLIAKKDADGNPLPQLLDGDKSEQFVRFRKNNDGSGYPMGDLQRMQAQKNFIMATVKQMMSIDGLKNINELIEIAQENVDTDLTFDEIYSYCTAVLTAEEGAIEFVEAPGAAADLPGGSYFVVDYDQAREVAQTRFYATRETMAKMQRIVVQPVQEEEEEPETEPDEDEDSDTGIGNRPGTDGSSAVTRPDEDEEPQLEEPDTEDSGTGAMSR